MQAKKLQVLVLIASRSINDMSAASSMTWGSRGHCLNIHITSTSISQVVSHEDYNGDRQVKNFNTTALF
jgi:hypothetical protein